jgi:hypothetical protein
MAVSGDSRGSLRRVLVQLPPQLTACQSFSDGIVSIEPIRQRIIAGRYKHPVTGRNCSKVAGRGVHLLYVESYKLRGSRLRLDDSRFLRE